MTGKLPLMRIYMIRGVLSSAMKPESDKTPVKENNADPPNYLLIVLVLTCSRLQQITKGGRPIGLCFL